MINNIVRNKSYNKRHKNAGRRIFYLFVFVLLALAGAGAWSWTRLLPAPVLNQKNIATTTNVVPITWPTDSEGAVGSKDFGVLANSGVEKQLPTASTAKLITALEILKKYPLSPGQQGPLITMSINDVNIYNKYVLLNGSVVKVTDGEQISEYQALQAMLLPSANNIADSLAIWAYGSLDNYIKDANLEVSSLGMTRTVVANDASGFAPNTVSTPDDLVKLGSAILDNKVLSEIVAQKSATITGPQNIENVNANLGQYGIIGIKTGNNDQDKGVYIFATNHKISDGNTVPVVGALMGAPSLQAALNESIPILQTTENNFQVVKAITGGQDVAEFSMPWQKNIAVTATKDLPVTVWGQTKLSPIVKINQLHLPTSSGEAVGQVSLNLNGTNYSSPVIVKSAIEKAPWTWRLFRGHLPIFK